MNISDKIAKYNILFIGGFPFPNAGGVGRVTETLASEFIKQGMNVFYLAVAEGRKFESHGITQYFTPSSKVYCKQNIQFVRNFIEEHGIHIIINQGGATPALIKLIYKANTRGARIFSVHHNCVKCLMDNYAHIIKDNYKNSKLSPLLRLPLVLNLLKLRGRMKARQNFRMAIRYSNRLILLSERFIPELNELTGSYQIKKVIGIPNPAPFRAVHGIESKKENVLLFVGRINIQQKRVDLLLEIWRKLYVDFPDWRFEIVGDGPELENLKARAKEINLDRIYFHGYTDPRPFLEKAKIFTMTSAFEGYGMVLVEAQAYGVVPLAFDTFSALKDIIKNETNGYIIHPYSIDDYFGKIRYLFSDEKLRLKLAANAMASVSNFDASLIANKWLNLFNMVSDE